MAEDGGPSVTVAIDMVLAENKLRWSASGDHASGETRRDQVRSFSDMSAVIENIKNRFKKMAVIDKHGKNMAVTVEGASKIVTETQSLLSSKSTPPPPPPCCRLSIRSHATACFLSNHAGTTPPPQRRLSTQSDAKVGSFIHHERYAPSPSLRCSSRRAKLECRASNNQVIQVAPKSSFRRGGHLGRSSHVATLERKACPRCSRWCKYENKTCSLIICPSCGKRFDPQTSSSPQVIKISRSPFWIQNNRRFSLLVH